MTAVFSAFMASAISVAVGPEMHWLEYKQQWSYAVILEEINM